MNTITKVRTNENRKFTLNVNGLVVGQLFAVYTTPTQSTWTGKVNVATDKGEFEYADEKVFSAKRFITAAQTALDAFVEENGAKVHETVKLTVEENSDRRVKMIDNDEGKPIPMSDLVRQIKLSQPKVTAESLQDYDDTQSAEDKALLA